MKHLRPIVFGLAALALCAAPVAVAQAARPGGASIQPVHRAGGLSGSELFGEFWAVTMDATLAGECIPLGPKGNVIAPNVTPQTPEVSCTVKPGTPLYLSFGSECSDVELPPFFGEDAAAQLECALAFNEEVLGSATLSVDGAEPIDTMARRFEVVSPPMTVVLPPNNILGASAGTTANFVAAGWAMMLRGLPPGEHTIEGRIDFGGSTFVAVITIDVVPRGRAG